MLCGTVVLVCGTLGSGSYLYYPFLVWLLFSLYHPCILVISLEILFVLIVCVLFWQCYR